MAYDFSIVVIACLLVTVCLIVSYLSYQFPIKFLYLLVIELQVLIFCLTATAGSNKAASSSTSLNTRKLDEETENLSRKFLFYVHN